MSPKIDFLFKSLLNLTLLVDLKGLKENPKLVASGSSAPKSKAEHSQRNGVSGREGATVSDCPIPIIRDTSLIFPLERR